MPILQNGSFSVTSLVRPGVYVDVIPPAVAVIAGASTSILGFVGVGSWGPLNRAMVAGSLADSVAAVGPVTVRTFDLSTSVALAALQGASNFRLVRVSDGTDTAASVTLPAADDTADAALLPVLAAAVNGVSQLVTLNAATGAFTALYTGILGNKISVAVSKGSKVGSTRVTIGMSGTVPETYDNLVVSGTPTTATYALAGGTDGAGAVITSSLLGVDASPRTGAYALRGTKASVIAIPDCTDSAMWTAMAALALSMGSYAVMSTPQGDSIANAVAVKAGVGLDTYAAKLMLGDWLYWLDATNGITRLVSPAAVAAGELVSLSPEQSSLNKELTGIIGSQHCGLASAGILNSYSDADIALLENAGIDVITTPSPGGSYWSCATGHNTSSDSTRSNDAYTSMTNFLAKSIEAAMGIYVGKPISVSLLQNMRSSLLSFLNSLVTAGVLDTLYNAKPYSVVCDSSNNPQESTGTGFARADVTVQYQGINEKLLVNLNGGATVTVAS